jgi:hypothetical protein
MTTLRNAMAALLPGLALALAATFFGIAVYISIAEQPARLALSDAPQLAQWKMSFGVGIALQGPLAIMTALAGIGAWWSSRDWRWMAGGLLMLANWPWTLIFIAPINATLMGTGLEAASPASRALVEQWGQLHAVRTGIGLAATVLFIWADARRGSAS